MSTNQDLIDAVVNRLGLIPNIGQVHGRQRFNADWPTYLRHFSTTINGAKQLRGWMVTMADANPIEGSTDEAAFAETVRTYRLLVIGVMDLADEADTEGEFLDLAEAVMDDLDGRSTLDVAGVDVYGVGPCSMRVFQARQFGSVLCHYTEIVAPVQVRKSYAGD